MANKKHSIDILSDIVEVDDGTYGLVWSPDVGGALDQVQYEPITTITPMSKAEAEAAMDEPQAAARIIDLQAIGTGVRFGVALKPGDDLPAVVAAAMARRWRGDLSGIVAAA